MTAPGYRLDEAAFEAAYKAYLDCPIDMCGDHDEECAKTVRAAIVAYLTAAPKTEPPADLVERAKAFRREWLSDDAHLYSGEGTPDMMAAFAQGHAAAEKARADKAEKAQRERADALKRKLQDAEGIIRKMEKLVDRAADGAGSRPAKESVKLIAHQWHAIMDHIAAIRARKGGGDESPA